MELVRNIRPIIREYEKWVGGHPCTSAEVESAIKYLSYLFTSQFENSNLLSELIFTLSKLLAFFNDQIIYRRVSKSDVPNPYESKLKKWLTIINHCEVFIELSAQKAWGSRGKWMIIVAIQLFKSTIRLCLLFYHKEQIVEVLPIPALDRKNLDNGTSNLPNLPLNRNAVSLKNGKMIRTVEAAPSIENRTWKALNDRTLGVNKEDKILTDEQIKGEILYIVKPLLHLGSMYCFGQKSWKSWLIAFSLDVASLRLISKANGRELEQFSKRQRVEVIRRTMILFMYLMRSPFFDRQTKQTLFVMLTRFSRVPMLGVFFKSLLEYLPQWQQTYFYLWSS
ncbi:peroxisomal membrane protein PEX16 [Planococcus citri]|uniref:peroxisomal membrane protein PEX16 n=1 Tax=Planococcus citri TaxID=170843 RepID=UPI0031F9DE6F